MGLLSSITKPFKKVLKSPVGKAALMLGIGHFGPKFLGAGKPGFGQWGNVPWKNLPWWKAGVVAGGLHLGAGELGEEEETMSVADASGTGHDDYLRMRQMFIENDPDVWTNKTPMFSRGSQGGRVGANIGLYAGQGGGMNRNMNPMMNQGLGAMGSQGMNPFNQQNLMNQAQMRGQPQGRPPVPGGPTTAQGPGIPSARLPKQTEDNELLQLIKMLASMGIPMEQLRGRTKEELVEMVMSLSAKAEAQGGGEEVVEEEQEEVVEVNQGGRIGMAEGWDPGVGRDTKGYQSTHKSYSGGWDPGAGGEQHIPKKTPVITPGGDKVPKGPVNYGQRYDPTLSFGSNIGKNLKGADLAALFTNYYQTPTSDENDPNTWDYQPQGGMIDTREDEVIDLGFAVKPEAAVALDKVYGSGLESRTKTYDDILAGNYNQGGLTRTRYAMGTEQPIIPSRDGPQIDYRNIGGYQPHGAKEKKDDVRALLAQGEFVVTSDAVKGIGDGDRDVGAKRMYDMMHKYEPIGRALS